LPEERGWGLENGGGEEAATVEGAAAAADGNVLCYWKNGCGCSEVAFAGLEINGPVCL